MPPEARLAHSPPAIPLPETWRLPLLQLAIAWAGLVALFLGEWRAMAHQWWDISTYNHILLVPVILIGLVHWRAAELGELAPSAWWPGLAFFALAALMWIPARAADVDLFSQVTAVAMLQGAVLALLGPRVTAALLFPLGYMLFLVPFGDELVPALQALTAKIAVALTLWSGVPARIEGVFIDTPAGLFEVAEACSGVKFLAASIALGVLVARTCFRSWRRRVVFLTVAVLLPVLANGVRAWGTIYIAQSHGIAFAAGFDHIVYGWIFFALVTVALLGGSWRFFDRPADESFVDAEALKASPLLTRLEWRSASGWRVFIALALVAFAALGVEGLVNRL